MKNILVTGSAGFIGFHTVKRLLAEGYNITGLDNINDYYDVGLKYGRLKETGIDRESVQWGKAAVSNKYGNYKFFRIDLQDDKSIEELFEKEKFDHVVHLAAQAGVRYSLVNPKAYTESNVTGFLSILEACRKYPVKHLLYASTSSVFGANKKMPFSEHNNADHPVSLYAASKKANEAMAHSYSHLYGIPATGLRFFTVYGPWGRPDMAVFLFTKAILENRPIQVFNNGNMARDFTFIDDIVEGICRLLPKPPAENKEYDMKNPDPCGSYAPYRIFNIGNSRSEQLMDFISAIEEALGKTAEKEFMPMQPGDVPETWADVSELDKLVSYKPDTPVREGVRRFVEWYLRFYAKGE